MAQSKISGDLQYYDGATAKSLVAEIKRVDTEAAAEAARAAAAEQANAESITAETTRAKNAESALGERVSALEEPTVVFGVQIDTTNSNPSTAVTYTDDAVGFTPARGNNGNYQRGTIEDFFPFNQIKPCLLKNGAVVGYLDPTNFAKFEGGDAADITSGDAGDVMIEIPRFYYKIARVGNYVQVKISNKKLTGYTDYAFSYKGSVKEKFYIGAYLGYVDGDSKLRSLSGKVVTGNKTIGAFRTAAQANGSGYEQLSFNKLTALQVLYVLQFCGLNSQAALGQGYTNNSSAYRDTGATDTKGMTYGTDAGAAADDTVKFNGIEDFYGNLVQWVDGFMTGGSAIKIADGNFNDTASGYTSHTGTGAASSGYIKDVVATNELGFTPKTAGGSTSTYYCDSSYISVTSSYLPCFGGFRSRGASAGAFCLDCGFSASSAYSLIGARLTFCG